MSAHVQSGLDGVALTAPQRLRARRRRSRKNIGTEEAPPSKAEFLECAPELAAVLYSGRPLFAHIAMAARLASDDDVPEAERVALRREFPGLLARFENAEGRILRWYMGTDVFAAAVLTSKDGIQVTLGHDLPAGSAQLVELIRRCQQIAFTAWHRLAAYDRRLCQNMIFSVIEESLRRMDTDGRVRERSCLKALSGRLDEAEQFMLRCATRRAQATYLKGMLMGTVLIGLTIAAIALYLDAQGHLDRLGGQLLLVATAGAVGASVSVLWRMTSGSFRMNLPTLSHDMKGTDVRLMAALRPVIGLVFALASIVLIMGAIIPIDQQSDPAQTSVQSVFYIGIGFLAGFSERLAQDMFVRSGQGLETSLTDVPTAGPSAGLSPPGAQIDVNVVRSA
jgi:hypothetical protein